MAGFGEENSCGQNARPQSYKQSPGTDFSRRSLMAASVLGSAGAMAATGLGISGMGGIMSAQAQTATNSAATVPVAERKIVDVHHHVVPPVYLAETRERQQPPVLGWSPQKSLDDMDRAGVATSMSSITSPGVWFGDTGQAIRLARIANDYMAGLGRDHKGRFGTFASLPMPDIDSSLKEIEYAFGTLKADGVGLMTSYGDKWLGDPMFFPVMEELNRRKAVVYTHPTLASCCGNFGGQQNLVPSIQFSMIEFGTDTTRAIASILYRGTALKYPNIRWIFSHCGGSMPFLIERFVRATPDLMANVPNKDVIGTLKSFNYDCAQATHPIPLGALVKLVSTSQLMFGTDFPFRTADDHVQGLMNFGFSGDELRAVFNGNALKLLPQVKI